MMESESLRVDVDEELPANAWMVRPCEWYKEEYKDCKSIRARFHQYFVFGKSIECDQWLADYRNCKNFRNTKSLDSLTKVIESEMARKEKRLKSVTENDVWELRDKPPDNWNDPLPEWLAEHKKGSFLEMAANTGVEELPAMSSFTGINCVIS